MEQHPPIVTRAEHEKRVRRLWKICILLACLLFVITGSVTGTMFYMGMDPKVIVAISTALFQVLVLSYGMGFFVPAFMTSLKTMSLGVEMSRRGLEVGQQTAANLNEFKEDVKPLIKDAREVVKDVKPMVSQVSNVVDESKKLFDDALKEIREGNGHLQGKIGDAVKTAVKEARKVVSEAEGDFERLIWTKVETFLGNVFDGGQEEAKEEQADEQQ